MVLQFIFIFCLVIFGSRADDTDIEERLIRTLLYNESAYFKAVRPGLKIDGEKVPLIVNVTFAPHQIVALDEKLETLSVMMYIMKQWYDPRLKWDPKEYDGSTVFTTDIKSDKIWFPRSYLPNLQLMNPDDKSESFNVRVAMTKQNPDAALVTLSMFALLQDRCDFDMTYFPFDRQSCRVCIYQLQYMNDEVIYQTTNVLETIFVDGGEWEYEYVDKTNNTFETYSLACVDIGIKRRSTYYVVNIFIPTMIICILNTIGLFASLNAADQNPLDFANLAQTTLLALSVLLLSMADRTPKGSDGIPMMGVYFLAMIFQTLLAAVTAVYLKIRASKSKPSSATYPISQSSGKQQKPKNCCRKISIASVWMIFHLLFIVIVSVTIIVIGNANTHKEPL